MDSKADCGSAAVPEPDPTRVFVEGISTCSEDALRSAFSHFGAVRDILVLSQSAGDCRRKRAPYCFVAFEDEASARRALASECPTELYKEIRPAAAPVVGPRRRSNRSKAKQSYRLEKVRSFAQEATLVVQAQTTHLDRLVAYLQRRGDVDAKGERTCKVLGSADANSKNLSFLFLSCNEPAGLARKLSADPLLARAIHKSYAVQPGLVEGNLSTTEGCDEFATILCERLSKEEGTISVRIQVYPPKDLQRLLQSIEAKIDETKQEFTINPKAFTHILSVVELYRYKGRGWEKRQHDANSRRYIVGVSPASPELDVADTNRIMSGDKSSGDEVSRAYFKLKEAIETYEVKHGPLDQGLYESKALDCGSSPGGWTRYLIERFRCRIVYSIDPGLLAPTVLELEATKHMQMRIQDALPSLLEDGDVKGQVKIWVSDMCLHKPEEQVDRLLLAREEGLLAPDAFFALTLKCIVGHSKMAFDAQAKKAVDKLLSSGAVEGVETFHLFSNRSGERTVIGSIN